MTMCVGRREDGIEQHVWEIEALGVRTIAWHAGDERVLESDDYNMFEECRLHSGYTSQDSEIRAQCTMG